MSTGQGFSHILIMDDESFIRGLVAKVMKRRGYAVIEAADGRTAVDQFAALPDEARARCLLILDLMVPGGTGGREALAEIRKDHPEIKAIIASGLSDDEQLEDIKEPGKTELLTKPYGMKALNDAVQAMQDMA